MVQILKNKKVKVIICLMIILIMLVLTMKQSYAAGDVSSVIQQAWKQMESQIKNIVNNVVFPVIDIILAVFFFAKLVGSQSVGDSAIKSLSYMQKLSLGTVLLIFLLIMMGYSIIKVFFANLKRGGILLVMIAVGSLYMFSIVRGYTDGFIQWCKQIIGICLTAFLQAVILIAGLGVMKENCLLGIGLILAASEIPRIAGQFGLDTSMKANIMSTVYAAQSAMNITKTIMNRS